jgi:uncharacterized protein YqeY
MSGFAGKAICKPLPQRGESTRRRLEGSGREQLVVEAPQNIEILKTHIDAHDDVNPQIIRKITLTVEVVPIGLIE